MGNLVLAWRMLLRDLRAGELQLLGFALLIAVASLTSVSFLADRVGRALDREANQLLGGDLLLSADRPWEARFFARAETGGLALAQTVLLTSMLASEQGMALAGVKAVDPNYPLRGAVRIAAAPGEAEQVAATMPAAGEIWLDERLFAELEASVGDMVQVGELALRVSAVLSFEADRGANIFSLLPRAVFNRSDLAASGLLGEGSRASWRLHLAGSTEVIADYEKWLSAELGRGQRIETVANARPEVRAALDQAQRFLRLAAMLAVILAAVAIGLCARRFIARHLDGCAVMRTLGASQAQLLTVFVVEFLLFGLLLAVLGTALGATVQALLGGALADMLGTALPAASALPLLHGLVVGLLLLLGFVLPHLLRLSRVSALRVLRRELSLFESRSILAWGLGFVVLAALLLWIAAELRLGLLVVVGFSMVLALFVLCAWLLIMLVERWNAGLGRARVGFGWRQGLAALGRRRGLSVLQVAALGLGISTLLVLGLLRGDLLAQWNTLAPADAPNRFVINIQPDQRIALHDFFVAHDLAPPLIEPMIRARLLAINDVPVKAENYPDERSRRLVEREFNLSWASTLPQGNEVIGGRWHGDSATPQFSVEQGLAQTFALKLGDRVAFEISGQRVEAPLTSIRTLSWDSMRVNFFFLAAAGMLESYPASLITSFHLPPGQTEFNARLVREFPNLTIIDVSAVLAQVQEMAAKLIFIVQGVFGFAVAAGLVVLLAALQSSHDERQYEFALLRTLGARRQQLHQALLAELGMLGVLAGVLAVLGATAMAALLARQLFELPYLPAWLPLLLTVLLTVAGVLAGGWFATRRLLSQAPLLSLRNQ